MKFDPSYPHHQHENNLIKSSEIIRKTETSQKTKGKTIHHEIDAIISGQPFINCSCTLLIKIAWYLLNKHGM